MFAYLVDKDHNRIFKFAATLLLFQLGVCTVTGTLNPFHWPCIPRDLGRGSIVCVCNSTYCDSQSIPPATDQAERDEIHIFTSDKTGQRLHKSSVQFHNKGTSQDEQQQRKQRQLDDEQSSSPAPPLLRRTFADTLNALMSYPLRNRISKFVVRPSVKYQKIIGFGGAFTDAAGINIGLLSKAAQENLIKGYFGRDGIDYSIGRVPIGGTDFSTRPYTYDDRGKEPDMNLTHFALQPEDFNYKIPYIKLAQNYSERPLKLVASPWSAPVWMKTNKKLNGAGVLKREFYQVWADYIARFLHEYKKEGVKFWAVTTGNEPFNGFIRDFPFNCMGWRAADMRDWIANNLGPTLKAERSEENVRIIIFDDNKGGLPTWTKHILENNASAAYVDGIGTHWYFDFLTGADVLSRVHQKHPEYFIIQTEACLGFTPWELEKVIPGSWERGEKYLEAIIRDMKNWVGGWLDWNLAVDLMGGPNWAKFAADAAILVNPETDEFFKQPIYYAIGHVSKFVPPDSVRIEMTAGSGVPSNLQSVAFLRPDNRVVIVFLNKLAYDAKVSLFDEEKGSVFLRVPARSIQTLIYNS